MEACTLQRASGGPGSPVLVLVELRWSGVRVTQRAGVAVWGSGLPE